VHDFDTGDLEPLLSGDPRTGTPLAGTYTIPPFTGCGFADGAVSQSLSLPGSTISLTLG